MKTKIRTSGIQYPILIEKPFDLWSRNVRDQYKSLPNEEIKQRLQATAFPFAVLMSQIEGDFNFSCVIRSANNFNASKVYYYGNRRYDKRAAVGCGNYQDVIHLPTLESIKALKEQYVFVGLENNVGDVKQLKDYDWKPNSILVLGEEGCGIAPEVLELLDHRVEIPSLGSVRSLNVASAASIAMYDYVSKKG